MKPEIKQLWVDALRSGEFTQGTGYLKSKVPGTDQVKHCCLGVLCELYIQSNKGVDFHSTARYTGNHFFYGPTDQESYVAHLPPQVLEWAGLLSSDPLIVVDNYPETLSTLNDGWPEKQIKAHTFEEIAELIDKYF